jgi:hypothetical protein
MRTARRAIPTASDRVFVQTHVIQMCCVNKNHAFPQAPQVELLVASNSS